MTRSVDARPRRGGPSVVALTFLVWCLAIPIFFADRLLNTDGDLASHLFLGRKVLEHGVVIPVDWTFTRPDAVFVAYEWLSELLLVAVRSTLGLAGIVALATILIAGSVALATAYVARRVEPFFAIPIGLWIAVLTAPHWSARPHLFSFGCLAVLLCVGGRRWRWRPPAVAALFAVWANLHPAFLYGLGMYAAYLAGDAMDRRDRATLASNGLAGAAAVAGTLANPLGWGLHAAVLEHVRDREAFAMVHEFMPTSLRTVEGVSFVLALALLAGLALASRRLPPARALLPLGLATAAALLSARFVPMFALYAFPVAVHAQMEPLGVRRVSWAGAFRARLRKDEAASTTAPWVAGGTGGLLAAALLSSRGILGLLPDEFSAEVFPVAAVGYARSAGLTGTPIFHEYTWGGYLLYAWPGQPIYIDGMANLFGSDLMREYRALYEASEGWGDTLTARDIGALLLPPDAPLALAARRSPDWRLARETQTAVLFTRRPDPRGVP